MLNLKCFFHLYEVIIALIGGITVVVLQELSQQSDTLLYFLDGVHAL